jgi:hypothetical protein
MKRMPDAGYISQVGSLIGQKGAYQKLGILLRHQGLNSQQRGIQKCILIQSVGHHAGLQLISLLEA